VHNQFIDKVKTGRGDRLKQDENLFTGLVWTGQQAVDLGLIDALGSVRKVATDVVQEPDLIDYTQGEGFLQGLNLKNIGSTLKNVFFSSEHPGSITMR
jgi:protease-4